MIWSLPSGNRSQTHRFVFQGPITCSTWITFDEPDNAEGTLGFAVGTTGGYIILCYYDKEKVSGHPLRIDFFAEMLTMLLKSMFEFLTQTQEDSAIQNLDYDTHRRRLASVSGGIPKVWSLRLSALPMPIMY